MTSLGFFPSFSPSSTSFSSALQPLRLILSSSMITTVFHVRLTTLVACGIKSNHSALFLAARKLS